MLLYFIEAPPPEVDSLISKGGSIICLVNHSSRQGNRPGKGGIVRKPEIHKDILTEVAFYRRTNNIAA